MIANIWLAFIPLLGILLYYKMLDVFVTLLGERDLFKSGHLQFVHNLREGLIIMKDGSFKTVKLINVAARQMLQSDTRYLE